MLPCSKSALRHLDPTLYILHAYMKWVVRSNVHLQLPEHNTHLEGEGDKIYENVMQMRSCGK